MDAGLAVNVTRLERILDPFGGISDLNGTYRACSSIREFKRKLEEATERIAERRPTISIIDLEEIAKHPPDWIVPDLISPGDKVLISGPPKSYKTWINLDLLRCLVSGTPFLQRAEWTPRQLHNTLFIEEEGSIFKWAQRVQKLQLDSTPRAHFLHRQGIRFTEPDTMNQVIGMCRALKIEVVFFDPMQRMIPGVDENDSAATGVVWDEIMRLQQAVPGIVCVITHHANKTEALTWASVRGSSRHAGEVDLGLLVEKTDDGECKIHIDGRDVAGSAGTLEARVEITDTLTINAADESVRKINPVKEIGDKNKVTVLEAVHVGCKSFQSIVSHTNLSESTVRRQIQKAIDAGVLREIDHGKGKAKSYELATGE